MIRIPVIAGPTASGKSSAALRLAEHGGGEIITADAMQVYIGMDIGTAKPTQEDQLRVPHHLINVIEPNTRYSIVQWANAAEEIIADVLHRGNIPIIAGGTAFYISALKNGLPTVPAADFKAQAPLWEMVHLGKLSELKAELQELAPQDALRAGDNPRRVVRAVEVLRATGNPPSSFPFTTPKFALHIMALAPTIEVLESRIHDRAQGMFDAGFMQEVEALHSSWNVDDFSTARQAIGYKELFEVIEGKKTLEEAKEVIVLRTRQYAKRQLTFIRSMDGIELLPGTGDSQYATIEAAVTQLFSN